MECPALPASKLADDRALGANASPFSDERVRVVVVGASRANGWFVRRRRWLLSRARTVGSFGGAAGFIGVAGGAVAGACQFLTNVAKVPS